MIGSEFVEAHFSGVLLQLFAQRAVFAPDCKTLFATDLHLGKDATFRSQGIAVPRGSSADSLRVLERLLQKTQAERLVILGDMFHARSSLSLDTCQILDGFFERHAELEMILVRGNHDARTGPLLRRWPIQIVESGYRLGALEFGHEPSQPSESALLYLCGHVHPAVRTTSNVDSLGKLPCFWYSHGCFVLPAIGRFTGTQVVKPNEGDRVWVVVDDTIFPYPAAT